MSSLPYLSESSKPRAYSFSPISQTGNEKPSTASVSAMFARLCSTSPIRTSSLPTSTILALLLRMSGKEDWRHTSWTWRLWLVFLLWWLSVLARMRTKPSRCPRGSSSSWLPNDCQHSRKSKWVLMISEWREHLGGQIRTSGAPMPMRPRQLARSTGRTWRGLFSSAAGISVASTPPPNIEALCMAPTCRECMQASG